MDLFHVLYVHFRELSDCKTNCNSHSSINRNIRVKSMLLFELAEGNLSGHEREKQNIETSLFSCSIKIQTSG